MPRAGYIVCSALGALDQYTNLVSCFNIIEEIPVFSLPSVPTGHQVRITAAGIPRPIPLRIVSTWLKEEAEAPELEYEAECVARFPGHVDEILVGRFEKVVFTSAVMRLVVPEWVLPFPMPGGTGVLTIDLRLRRKGENKWLLTQSFPIVLEPSAIPEHVKIEKIESQAPPQPSQETKPSNGNGQS